MKSVLTEQVYAIYIDAVRTPQLTVEHVDFFCDRYSIGTVVPSKLTTKEINKILMLLKLIGINNAPLRGELCICLILIKMWTTSDSCNVNVPVHENCDALYSHYNPIKFGSGKKSIPEDKFFSKFCYYLRVAVEVVQVKNLQRFIVENILVPLSGAIGVEYTTGSRESDQTGIRYQALGMESGIYRPKDVPKLFLQSEVPLSVESSTSSRPLQESNMTLKPEGSMLSKRYYEQTVTPSLKRVCSPSISEDGHTSVASDLSSIGDLSDYEDMMEVDCTKNVRQCMKNVPHIPSPCLLSSYVYKQQSVLSSYTHGVLYTDNSQENIPSISHGGATTASAATSCIIGSAWQNVLDILAED